MEGENQKITPMMKQFLELKAQYKDCILLFRAGDFYETFYDDAKICSQILQITLTKRANIPMAGVPYHSITPYIKKLISNNYKVAMCEQLEDPKQAKGLVKRGITRIITPGTLLEDEFLSSEQNNYIFCIYQPRDISEKFGIGLCDISTGELLSFQVKTLDDLKTLIRKYSPNEIVINEGKYVKGLFEFLKNTGIYFQTLSEIRFQIHFANEILKKHFSIGYKELGLENKEFAAISVGALLFYLYKIQKNDLAHINKLKYEELETSMILDSISLRNLEIYENLYLNDKKKTLFGILNNTKTSAGSRLLKKHLVEPLRNQKEIELRLDAVSEFNELIFERGEIRELLSEFTDIERIASRVSAKIATPRDIVALKNSLRKLPKIRNILELVQSDILKKIKKIESLDELSNLIESAIIEDAPSHTRDIGFIKKDFHPEILRLSQINSNSKNFLRELEEEERLKTKISTLKIKYNKIFGYYIEIPKSQELKVPSDYILRQNLVNASRYTKPELKEKEDEILGAEERIKNLELEIFDEIISKINNYVKKLQEIAGKIALLDVISTNSLNSQLYSYSRPEFSDEETIIIDGRNPIIERFTENFIPNDSKFSNSETFKIITGPNASGKSTYLRQNALIILMAQAGSFVPANSAKIRIYDRIFTRIGAHDELAEGQSTFMVEMSETANIINNASSKSLILLDEIGRGTSTYDGLAIAWAVVEELANKGAHTIFATHYHQLNELENFYPNIKNYHVLINEEGESIEFIRKIREGGTDKSFGLYAGKIAGIPERVISRAKEIQENIENKEEIKIRKEFADKIRTKTIDKISNPSLDKYFNDEQY